MIKSSLADYTERNDVARVEELLKTHKNINEFEYDKTALHTACVSNAINAAEVLIKNGIDVNARDKITGAVSLHYCAVYNYFELANLILKTGGKLNIADDYGNEPLWTAVFNVKGKIERLPIVELYLKHGADKNHKNNAGKSPLDFANQVKFAPLLEVLQKY
jgi:uncharacterized protein